MYACAREEQEATCSMRENKPGVEHRYGTGRAMPSLMMHQGRVVWETGSINSPRQGELTSQAQGDPKDPFRKGRRHGWRQGHLQRRCKVYPANPRIRRAEDRFGLRDTYNLSQGRSGCPGMSLNKTPVPTGRGVGCYLYMLLSCSIYVSMTWNNFH